MTLGKYDFVIVGGGSAGAVMASRLSEDPSISVCLIEAGKDTAGAAEPAVVRSPTLIAGHQPELLWPDYMAKFSEISMPMWYKQGRIMGGGSSVNATQAPRAMPTDFDQWTELGIDGWRYDDVRPYYRKLERDHDFDGDEHGKDGPIDVRRHRRADWPPFTTAITTQMIKDGDAYVDDMNGDYRDGVQRLTMTTNGERRMTTAYGYLTESVRARPNLTIIAETTVERLLFNGDKVIGVKSGDSDVFGNMVVLSAGALGSPAIMMRSGIGPKDELDRGGVTQLHALEGVGRNVQDHPVLFIACHIIKAAMQNPKIKNHLNAGWRGSSNLPGADPHDLYLNFPNSTTWNALGQRTAAVAVSLYKPKSTGRITLDWDKPIAAPHAAFNFWSEAIDLERMRALTRKAWAILDQDAVKPMIKERFGLSFTPYVMKMNFRNRRNAFLAKLLVLLLDGPRFLRKLLFRWFIIQGRPMAEIIDDDAALDHWIKVNATSFYHPCCSCRMGPKDDPMAVVDSRGSVHGVAGLSVVDASIMPTIPSANLNLTVIMMAEKIADEIKQARQNG